jgi:hypothetical protein
MKTVKFLTVIVLVATTLLVGCKGKNSGTDSRSESSKSSKSISDYELLSNFINDNRVEAESLGLIKKYSPNMTFKYISSKLEYDKLVLNFKISEDGISDDLSIDLGLIDATKVIMKLREVVDEDPELTSKVKWAIINCLYPDIGYRLDRGLNRSVVLNLFKKPSKRFKSAKYIKSTNSFIVNDTLVFPCDASYNHRFLSTGFKTNGRQTISTKEIYYYKFDTNNYALRGLVGSNLLVIGILENLDSSHPYYADFTKSLNIGTIDDYRDIYNYVIEVCTHEVSLKGITVLYKDIPISFIPKDLLDNYYAY